MSTKTKNLILIILCIQVLLMVFLSQTFAESVTINLRLAATIAGPPAGGGQADATDWFVKEVEKRTKGQVRIRMYWGGTLCSQMESLQAARTGAVADIFMFTSGFFIKQFPLCSQLGSGGYPFGYKDPMAISKAWWTVFDEFPELEAEHTNQNIKLLTAWPLDSGDLVSRSKPIRAVDDLKGLKVRTPGSAYAMAMKTLGGVPVSITSGEAYDAISKGVVDACVQSLGVTFRFRHYEVVKHITRWGYGAVFPYTGLVINLNTFKSLPTDFQKIMIDVGRECNEVFVNFLYDYCEKWEKMFKERGIEFHQFSPNDIERCRRHPGIKMIPEKLIIQPLEERGLPGRKIVERFQELQPEMMKRWARWK